MQKNFIGKNLNLFLIFILILIQRFAYGLKYFPVVDDWFLYFGRGVKLSNAECPKPVPDLSIRPFAGLFDHYVITPLAEHLVIIEILLTVMLIAACIFFGRCFSEKDKTTDSVFVLFMTIFPISFEGLYWISAASRIIPSLFFISLSCFCLKEYISGNKKCFLILFTIFSVFSVGFYEIFVPLYLFLSLCIIASSRKYYLAFLPFIFALLIACYYLLNSTTPAISERFSFVKPANFIPHIWYVVLQYKNMLFNGVHMMINSFRGGLNAAINMPLYGISIIILSIVLALVSKPIKQENTIKKLIFAFLLMSSATALNFVADYVRLPFRLFVPMSLGISYGVQLILCKLPKIPYKVFVAIFAVVFSVTNTQSLALYKKTFEYDTANAYKLIRLGAANPERITFILNAPQYCYDDNTQWYEYVKCSTENYAPITGQVQYLTKNGNIPNIMCVHSDKTFTYFTYDASIMQFFWYDNGKYTECKLTPCDTGYSILNGDKILGEIISDGSSMRLICSQ